MRLLSALRDDVERGTLTRGVSWRGLTSPLDEQLDHRYVPKTAGIVQRRVPLQVREVVVGARVDQVLCGQGGQSSCTTAPAIVDAPERLAYAPRVMLDGEHSRRRRSSSQE